MITRSKPKVYVVVLNWNNAEDTIECLESVYRLTDANFQVIVCDNASTDGSVERIARWARGELSSASKGDATVRALTDPPVPKPLTCVVREGDPSGRVATDADLVVLSLPENGGYAAGNNAGIRFGLARGDADYFWILNNDTVVERRALAALVERAQGDATVGLVGSMLLDYDAPHLVQAAGGATFPRWSAVPRHIGEGLLPRDLPDEKTVSDALDFVVGASVLATRRFVDDIGLMAEDYFLYYEEVDWILRAQGRYGLAFAAGSVVFHKYGSSAGSSQDWRTRSEISDLCAVRNRLLITRRYFPAFYPVVYATIVIALARRLFRRQPRRALQVLRIMAGPGSYRLPKP